MQLPPNPRVCLVRCLNGMQHKNIFFQVTIDPARTLPNSNFIRFGGWSGDKKGAGDELTGWMHLAEWEVVWEIGDLDANGNLVIEGGKNEQSAAK